MKLKKEAVNGCAYNEEIKVGEYVRTHEGYIAKFKKYVNSQSSKCKLCIFDNSIRDISHTVYDEDNFLFDDELEEYIANHSKNIMDLIEKGDYVDGFYVVDRDKNGICVLLDTAPTCYSNIYEEQHIKTIVTHEQFEQIKYIVKE